MARKKNKKETTEKRVDARSLWGLLESDWPEILLRAGIGTVKQTGQRITTHCPYHPDSHPSFEVRPDRGYARCYSCGVYVTDPVSLLEKIRSCGYADAIAWLIEQFPTARKLIDNKDAEALTAAVANRGLRRMAIECSQQKLREALELWRGDGVEEALINSQLGWALTMINWLLERRFGLAPDENITDPAVRDRVRATWSALASAGLIGTLPPLGSLRLHMGEGPDTDKAYYLAFGDKIQLDDVGLPVLPYRHLDGSIGIVKLRADAHVPPEQRNDKTPKYTVASTDPERGTGFYFASGLVMMLRSSSSDEQYGIKPIEPMIVEGETSVLSVEAAQREEEIGMPGILSLGGGMAAIASIDPLYATGIRRVFVARDHDKGGDTFARKVAAACKTRLAIHVLVWPENTEEKCAVDDAVEEHGVRAEKWLRSGATWLALCDWCLLQARAATQPGDEPARRGQVAIEWGRLLRDDQDRATYVAAVAVALGIAPGPIERTLTEILEGAIIPRDLSTTASRVAEVVRGLRGDDVEAVFADGAVWRCQGGLWREVTVGQLEAAFLALDGRTYQSPDMDEPDVVRLKPSDPKTLARLVPTQIARPDFFSEARKGVADATCKFLRAECGRIVPEPLRPEHRQRWALPVAYVPVGYDAINVLGGPARDRCPRFRRFLFEILRATHCTCRSLKDDSCAANELIADKRVVKHVCWPRDRVSAPTQAWLHQWRETVPLMRALCEFVGVSLLGEATRFEQALLLHGPGANGKSTLLKIIRALTAAVTCSLGPQELGEKFSRAMLVGKLLNLVDEISAREMVDTKDWKAVISGMRIKGEHKHRDPFDFAPRAGHVYGANELPLTRDQSRGFWRRPLVMPMRHVWEERHMDRKLADYIIENELADVAALFLEAGAAALARGHYTACTQSTAARDEWREQTDPVLAWIRDATTRVAEPRLGTPSRALYGSFLQWAKDRGHAEMSETLFGTRMVANVPRKKEHGVQHYAVKLRPPISVYGDTPSVIG